ncbi:hypothetical protein [Streptomyces sp. NPDC096152]
MELCEFALGRLPERSVVLVRNFDSDIEAGANTGRGAGEEPVGWKKQ